MDFSLTDDQIALRDLAEQICTGRASAARVEQVETTVDRFDRELWAELAKAGLLGVALPDDAGGLGLDLVDLVLVCEELGRAVAPVPYVWTSIAALAVSTHGSAAQRDRYLSGVVAGDAVLGIALPQCVEHVDVEGDRVSGTLAGVPAAHLAAALLVPVGEDVFVVDPAAPEVTLRTGEGTDRQLYSQVDLDAVPAERLGGSATATWLWHRTALALAAVQAGVTSAALRMTAEYTSQRHQFGKPLSSFQGVALKAADGYIDSAVISAAVRQAAWRLDRDADAAADILSAAWWAAEGGQHCVHITQHLHGGMGADITYPIHRYFLWGKQIELMLGGGSALLARLGDVLDAAESPGDALVLAER